LDEIGVGCNDVETSVGQEYAIVLLREIARQEVIICDGFALLVAVALLFRDS
jgi:hypothetical protein